MEENVKSNMEKWHQIVVPDQNYLSGPSTKEFFEGLIEKANLRWAIVRDLQGAYNGLQGKENSVICTKELLNMISDAVQYDWGNFFLYIDKPCSFLIVDDDRVNITSTDVTVRLVDDQYFYIYTQMTDLFGYLRGKYRNFVYKHCDVDELEMPY